MPCLNVALVMLLGTTILVQDPVDTAPPAQALPEETGDAETLAEYNALREKTPRSADGHWKLALWCDEHGLKAQATAHLTEVVRLDPKRDAAWRRLGYKRRDGRWMTDEQIRDEAEQKEADKVWGDRLEEWHKDLHGGPKQGEVEAELVRIDDPRAVPSIIREFAGGSATDQKIAIQTLGQIRDPKASRALAVLAVYGRTDDVRRSATETLRWRNPDEYVDLLVSLLAKPLKYEIRPVGGPGSPGVLLVEGERFNVQRIYSAPPPPFVSIQPGDVVDVDAYGLPIVYRRSQLMSLGAANNPFRGTEAGKLLSFQLDVSSVSRYSYRDALIEARRTAQSSEAQLEADTRVIDAANSSRMAFDRLVLAALRDGAQIDLGDDPDQWKDRLAEQRGYARLQERPKPTVNQFVPLAYVPQFTQQTLGIFRDVVPDH